MELDFDKYCIVDGSPTTVLPAPRRRSKVATGRPNPKPACGNYTSNCDENYVGINYNRYRSASCRDARSRRSTREVGSERPKRGSVYKSSKEVMHLRKDDAVLGRKKIELSRGSASALSFGIIDSLCSSDEDSSVVDRNRSSVMSLSEQSTSSFCESQVELSTRDSTSYHFPQRIPRRSSTQSSDKREKRLTDCRSVQDVIRVAESNIDILKERDPAANLHKSLSAKLGLPHSPTHSETDVSKTGNPKVRLNPARKAFDPFMKSKSHRSPLSSVNEAESETVNELHHTKKENSSSVAPSSPAHLHGILKLEKIHGALVFEFSVKSLGDVYIAKMWSAGDALKWIYTFHSLHLRRKSNASGWGLKDNNREPAMVGQMNVSCYQCKELNRDRTLDDSMVTEFVLYDTAHSTNPHKDSASCSPNVSKVSPVPDEPSSCEQNEVSAKTNRGQFLKNESSSSSSQLLAATELQPELEVAAMVVQIPLIKRPSLKFRSGELDLHCADNDTYSERMSPGKIHVVIPDGNHSRPSTTETCGTSPLLDRWRLGGGCGCGGWDMACPLHVFGNPSFEFTEGFHQIDNQSPAQLFVQGRKDNVPAFSMSAVEGGKYKVDFHAQLSSLQAFAICIAIFHAAETSPAFRNERCRELLQSDSLRVFADEEVKRFVEDIGEEMKFTANKKMGEVLPNFVLNPPFSPIARV
ncbi:uncharacterized protein LOC127265541 [Andrographis paniculata]|uniref:uncharacterized protein LOC127265541 n=1 Tax=Andrographis paniculata TaxID=175694 RepID=UPI0021E7BC78|nr:uncharacterized protein LOC127265541 [Andrographis paniculata]XP_051151328.1 uncharacterized protein LOC127265541 [Andrographis paniculata]